MSHRSTMIATKDQTIEKVKKDMAAKAAARNKLIKRVQKSSKTEASAPELEEEDEIEGSKDEVKIKKIKTHFLS